MNKEYQSVPAEYGRTQFDTENHIYTDIRGEIFYFTDNKVMISGGDWTYERKYIDDRAADIVRRFTPFVAQKCTRMGYNPAQVAEIISKNFDERPVVHGYGCDYPAALLPPKTFIPTVSGRSGTIIDLHYR